MTLESTIEDHLVKRVKALGGICLKGAIPGRRFIDRICILPDGVTLWIEVKKPKGGRRTALQEKTIADLLELGHQAFFVKTKAEVDMVVDGIRIFYTDGLVVWTTPDPNWSYRSTPKGLVPR